MANAGRVLILAKGAWSATTNYTQLDMVSYNSVAYLARQASVGVDPSTDVQMNYWMPFGSAAQIATTSTPGLVMPDGTSITITNTGLIKAVLGLNDVSDVTITSPSNGQVLKYNSSAARWENGSLGTAASKNSTNAVTSGSTNLVESGAVYTETSGIKTRVTNLETQATNKVLYLTGVACAATTGNFVSKSDSNITANHVVASVEYANPSAITTDVTWTTANGRVKLNGTCASATTCSIVLVKKDN